MDTGTGRLESLNNSLKRVMQKQLGAFTKLHEELRTWNVNRSVVNIRKATFQKFRLESMSTKNEPLLMFAFISKACNEMQISQFGRRILNAHLSEMSLLKLSKQASQIKGASPAVVQAAAALIIKTLESLPKGEVSRDIKYADQQLSKRLGEK